MHVLAQTKPMDWERIDKLTDDDINAMIADNPDEVAMGHMDDDYVDTLIPVAPEDAPRPDKKSLKDKHPQA